MSVRQQRKVIADYNSAVNKWVTVSGTLLGPLEAAKEAGISVLTTEASAAQRSIQSIKALKALKFVNNQLTHIGLITDMIGVMLEGVNTLEAEINGGKPEKVGEAWDALRDSALSFGKDYVLAAISPTPIGLCFNVMNGILTAFDDQWFTKLVNEDWDGPDLAEAITNNLSRIQEGQNNDEKFSVLMAESQGSHQSINAIRRHTGGCPTVGTPYLKTLVAPVDQHNSLLFDDNEKGFVAEVKKWTLSLSGRNATELTTIIDEIAGTPDFEDVQLWLKSELSDEQYATVNAHFASVGL